MRLTAYLSIWLHLCELKLCLKSGLCSKAVSKALLISAHFWETFRACKIVIKLTPGYRNKLPRCQCTVKWQLRLVPSQVQSWSDLVRILAVISGGSGTRVKRSLSYGAAQDELLSRRATALLRNARPESLRGSICHLKGESLWIQAMITASSVAWESKLRENPDFLMEYLMRWHENFKTYHGNQIKTTPKTYTTVEPWPYGSSQVPQTPILC